MKIGISFGFYILFLIANIEGRFLLVNIGDPDVDDDYDDPRKEQSVNFGDPDVDDDYDDPRIAKPVKLGDPDVDDVDGPRKDNPAIGKNICRIEVTE